MDELMNPGAEPNEVGPGAIGGAPMPGSDSFSDPAVAELFQLLVTNQAAKEAAIPSEEEFAREQAELERAAAPDPKGQILGALLAAAMGAAIDGKRGALTAAGGAADQMLNDAQRVEKQLNARIEQARQSREKKLAAASKGKDDVIKLALTETLKDQREQFKAAVRLQAAALGKSSIEINMPDKERNQLASGKVALQGLKGTMDLVKDSKYSSNWLDVIFNETLDPKSVEAQVKGELNQLAISMAGLEQAGVLTEKDVAPFRNLAGLRSFKNKESLLQNLTRLYNRSLQKTKALGASYTDIHNNPEKFFAELDALEPVDYSSEAGPMAQAITATNPKTGKKVVFNPETGKWE